MSRLCGRDESSARTEDMCRGYQRPSSGREFAKRASASTSTRDMVIWDCSNLLHLWTRCMADVHYDSRMILPAMADP